jgi:hypothetical protein
MRDDRGVPPDEIAISYWVDRIPPEDMPMLAARMLADGHDTPALRQVAGLTRRDDPRDIRDEFQHALAELGVWIPDRDAAELAAGISLARGLVSGELPIAECADRVCDIWEFDEVTCAGLPDDLADLVLMCWLLGDEYYVLKGGDGRLLAAARALASRVR